MSRIALDLDGVIGNYVQAFTQIASEIRWCIPPMDESDWTDYEGRCTGLLPKQRGFIEEHTDLFRRESLYPDAELGIRELYGAGHEIEVVTDRFCYPEIERDTRIWIAEHVKHPYGRIPKIHFVRSENKPAFIQNQGFAAYLDDKAETVIACETLGVPAFLLQRPWTGNTVNPLPVTWREFTKEIIQAGGKLICL